MENPVTNGLKFMHVGLGQLVDFKYHTSDVRTYILG